jgi:two-component system response regulator NreC
VNTEQESLRLELGATPISIVLADDHTLLREGVAALIAREQDLVVVGQAGTADRAVALCSELRPTVAMVELGIPGSGVDAVKRIVQASTRTHVLALTVHDDPAHLHHVLAAGGFGYVLKSIDGKELMAAIRAVANGQSYVRVTGDSLRGDAAARAHGCERRLSVREKQVLIGIARGFSHREIAEQLGLGVKTVETYRSRLNDKLGTTGRASLVDYALSTGLLGDAAGSPRGVGGVGVSG